MGTHELTCGQFHLQGSATASTGACLAGTKLRDSKGSLYKELFRDYRVYVGFILQVGCIQGL